MICWAFAIGGMIVAVFVRTVPSRYFSGINIFGGEEVQNKRLDETLPSLLRRKSTARMGSVYEDTNPKSSIHR